MPITQFITPYDGTVPNPTSQSQAVLNGAATTWAEWFANAVLQVNDTFTEANQYLDGVSLAQVATNFKGAWSNLTGSLPVPATVFHNNQFWLLLNDLADVTLYEPSDSSEVWVNTQIPAVVLTPSPISPVSSDAGITNVPTLSATAYSNLYQGNARDYRRFEIDTLAGDFSTPVYAFDGDTDAHEVESPLPEAGTYKWRCKDFAVSGSVSNWSEVQEFNVDIILGDINTQGNNTFGVGVASYVPSGMSTITGTATPGHDNYGNYETTNGSIMVFIPRFYYRIGSASSPRYAVYGDNAIDIEGVATYETEALANADGFAMPRAFIDGGETLDGFFIDKYAASPDGTGSCKSIFQGHPISLAPSGSSYYASGLMSGCVGNLTDAIRLSSARGSEYHCASAFQYSALALLSLAHAQAATNTDYCAWHDPTGTTNFPKGCNANLSDTNDPSVTYSESILTKPRTGAITNFAKTTHNGQMCGVADLNGGIKEVAIGVVTPGDSTDAVGYDTHNDLYVLKEGFACKDLTPGWGGVTDAWGNSTHLITIYDKYLNLRPLWDGPQRIGNLTNQVFDPAVSGTGYIKTAIGYPKDTSATSSSGISMFGSDQIYVPTGVNSVLTRGGDYVASVFAGIFALEAYNKNLGYSIQGFRAARALPTT